MMNEEQKVEEQQVIEEQPVVEEKPKKKHRIINIILIAITIFIVVVFILFMKTSITNFNLVKQKKEPTGYISVVECKKDYKNYKYYKYNLFQIEIVKSETDTSYSLIPSFIKDTCKELREP